MKKLGYLNDVRDRERKRGGKFIALIDDTFFCYPFLLNKKELLAMYGIRTLNQPTGIHTQTIGSNLFPSHQGEGKISS
jgi:hypothetical protein